MREECVTTACDPVDCVLGTPPSDWGDCSKTCGGGKQTRNWNIQTQHAHGGNDCQYVFDSQSTAKDSGEYFGSITGNTLISELSCNTQACDVDCEYTAYVYTPCMIRNIEASCLPPNPNGQIPKKTGTRTIKTHGTGDGACDVSTLSTEIECTSTDLPNQCGADHPDTPPQTYDVGKCKTDPLYTTYRADCTWNGLIGTRPGEQSQRKWVYANNSDGSGRDGEDMSNRPCVLSCDLPVAPTRLSATAITHESFELSWTPNTNGDTTLSSYTIIVSKDGVTSEYDSLNPIIHTYAVTGLESNTSYNVKVRKNFSSGPTVPLESRELSVTTTKLTNKVNLHFPTLNLSDDISDVLYFKFKSNGKTYTLNAINDHSENQETIGPNGRWNFEEGGHARISAEYAGINDVKLNNFDLENLDFVEIKVYPFDNAPSQRQGGGGGSDAGQVKRSFIKTKAQIEDKMGMITPTNGIYTLMTSWHARREEFIWR